MDYNFAQLYEQLSIEKSSKVSVGLDPNLERIPRFISEQYETAGIDLSADIVLNFNKFIIDLVADLVPVVKPQLAYYEKLGWRGYRVYEETVEYAKSKGLLVIADAKRGDIDSTATAYAEAFLSDRYGSVSAVTVNPYLGKDSVIPFFKQSRQTGKGIFLLVKTSNPGSQDIQDVVSLRGTLVRDVVRDWIVEETENVNGQYSNIGAVVGATHPEEMSQLRISLKKSLFLVPGIGAQGGDIKEIHRVFDKKGHGAVINSSRGILYPESVTINSTKEEYAEAVIYETIKLNTQINEVLINNGKH
ncbi:orotidine-5'-phosphate decarboxylase [Leuconostoc sp. MS02]|uniref:Orotidine 5'-phosphate decarboxylase n=1 Tax=Leuconostoc aquikimchii TaxID=3236804 RepID=A0ABV3S6A2_9LACO